MDDEWRIDDVEPGRSASHELVFSEDVAAFREDLLAEAVDFLKTLPGVAAVERVERQAIAMAAHTVPTWQLTEAVRRWWEAAKEQRRPWMIAMDRAAQTVFALAVAYGSQRHDWELTRVLDRARLPAALAYCWELTRVLDAELTHVITLDHQFGDEPGEHSVIVTAGVRLKPDLGHYWIMQYVGKLDDDVQFASAITDRVLPTLDAFSTVDAMLDRWQDKPSIEEGSHVAYWPSNVWLHARVLVSRGRLVDARQVCQQDFERSQPKARPSLLWFVEGLGLPPLTTATNPHLTVAEEATLAAWQANTTSMIDQLRSVTGVYLDGSRQSVDELWAWLRDSPDRLQATFANATPALAVSYYGVHTGADISSGRASFEPWYRVTVELVTAYLGEVVIGEAPATVWGINGDGELALIRHDGGTGVLWRVFAITREAFGAPVDEFDPRRLRRLADDMVRWVTQASKAVVRHGVPGP